MNAMRNPGLLDAPAEQGYAPLNPDVGDSYDQPFPPYSRR